MSLLRYTGNTLRYRALHVLYATLTCARLSCYPIPVDTFVLSRVHVRVWNPRIMGVSPERCCIRHVCMRDGTLMFSHCVVYVASKGVCFVDRQEPKTRNFKMHISLAELCCCSFLLAAEPHITHVRWAFGMVAMAAASAFENYDISFSCLNSTILCIIYEGNVYSSLWSLMLKLV